MVAHRFGQSDQPCLFFSVQRSVRRGARVSAHFGAHACGIMLRRCLAATHVVCAVSSLVEWEGSTTLACRCTARHVTHRAHTQF